MIRTLYRSHGLLYYLDICIPLFKIRMNWNFLGEREIVDIREQKSIWTKCNTHLYTGLLSLYHTTSSKLSLRIGGLESQANSASPPTTAATRVTVPVTVDNGLPATTMRVHIDKGIENWREIKGRSWKNSNTVRAKCSLILTFSVSMNLEITPTLLNLCIVLEYI